MKLFRIAVLVAAFVARPSPSQLECTSTCLDYCQTQGADLADSCSCNFGQGAECACLCSNDPGSHDCGDFDGCESVWNNHESAAKAAAKTCPAPAAKAQR